MGNEQKLLDHTILAALRSLDARLGTRAHSAMQGNYKSAFRGSGYIFADLREYQPGDSVRDIHWKASVRSGKTFVKVYEEERQLTLLLAVDQSASVRALGWQAESVAAYLGALGLLSGDSVGVATFDTQVRNLLPVSGGQTQLIRLLSLLNQQADQQGQATDLKACLPQLLAMKRSAATLFLISDFYDSGAEDVIKTLSAHFELVCCAVGLHALRELPAVGPLRLRDPENGKLKVFDTSSKNVREAFRDFEQKREEKFRNICMQAAVDHLVIEGNVPDSLTRFLAGRTRRMNL